MLKIYCPYCEQELPEIEFHCEGEAHIVRPDNLADISDADFEKFFFIRENPKGIVFERWRHVHGCGRFFNVVRHSVSDKIIKTYKAGEPMPKLTKTELEAVLPPAKTTPANDAIWKHGERQK